MSAVILAVIVIMWAVVLVPMWLRRHDTATENRSVDRFSTAMRVLSRRQPAAPDRRYVVMPKRDARPSVHVSGASAPSRPAPSRPATRPTSSRPAGRPSRTTSTASRSMAARRRRTLLVLLGATFLTFVLAIAGATGWVFQLVVDLVLVAFVVHLRTQAKRMAQVRTRRGSAAAADAAHEPARRSGPARAPRQPVARPARAAAPVAQDIVAPGIVGPDVVAEDLVPFETAADESTGTDGGNPWSPVPVPRPTYTMKPRAPRRWTFAPPSAADAPAAEVDAPAEAGGRTAHAPSVEVDPSKETAELEVILEHRWAVND